MTLGKRHTVSQQRKRRKEAADAVPEGFKDGFAVGSNLLNVQPGVSRNGGSIPLDTKVAAQFHIEPHLFSPMHRVFDPFFFVVFFLAIQSPYESHEKFPI